MLSPAHLAPHQSLNSSFVLMSTYAVLVPLSYTVAPRYNITNIALLGCFYLAQGVGNAAASQVTGRYADWMLRKWAKKRKVSLFCPFCHVSWS